MEGKLESQVLPRTSCFLRANHWAVSFRVGLWPIATMKSTQHTRTCCGWDLKP